FPRCMAGRRHASASSVDPNDTNCEHGVCGADVFSIAAAVVQASARADLRLWRPCNVGRSANHIYGYFYIVFARIVSFKETRRQCSRAQPVTGTSPDSRGLRTPHAASTAPPKVKPYANS